jgi:hypothetical protein
MIGGVEYQIPARAGESSVRVAVSVIQHKWPRAVFENGETGERYNDIREIPFEELREIFVYRDLDAADAWDRDGAVPEDANTMVHLIADEGLITMIIDEKDAFMDEIRNAIASRL